MKHEVSGWVDGQQDGKQTDRGANKSFGFSVANDLELGFPI